ncbi:NAF1-domain-containing protein [Dendrothele bispora CBS 962.96]|uniref:H/ACA ribonucleoprotein complex non-core subunit NAF1 n=1 Tax=Dendrothele bispora (strain CBS 962.96) TaxID=1314807 RepID=A0A4S8MVX9_DENBC|nr:NAF1-domain-containing protein [Dendrothele bispora CBS 962.96]
MDAFQFKVPSNIPQDLLLIQEIVGVIPSTPPSTDPSKPVSQVQARNLKAAETEGDDSDIDSSGSEVDSEEEIEAQLVQDGTGTDAPPSPRVKPSNVSSSDSDSDSDDSDSSSSFSPHRPRTRKQNQNSTTTTNSGNVKTEEEDHDLLDLDDEDSGGPSLTSSHSYFRTKNEVVEAEIIVPDIEQVGEDEQLEKVGEIMGILESENLVIVKGDPVVDIVKATDRALDSDTLLFFEDRKVLGYVFETFGPTTQPMYQIKFNSSYPLDLEKIRISRPVFHVPQRSHFVWVRQLAVLKGSDASNMNDEEPADHELDFSDDEAEAEFKRNLKKKRAGSRASSVAASSRHGTPTPSQMRDQDMSDDYFSGRSPYDEVGPYDTDYSLSSSSRPTPIPYDDPYSDEFNRAYASTSASSEPFKFEGTGNHRPSSGFSEQNNRGRPGRGRGRGGDGNRGRRRGGRGNWRESSESRSRSIPNSPIGGPPQSQNPYDLSVSVPAPSISPHSAPSSPAPPFLHHQTPMSPWTYPSQNFMGMSMGMGGMQPQHAQQQSFIQPHINPRFASQFGMGMGVGIGTNGYPGTFAQNGHAHQAQQQWHSPQNQQSQQTRQWNHGAEWTVHDGSQSHDQNNGSGQSDGASS